MTVRIYPQEGNPSFAATYINMIPSSRAVIYIAISYGIMRVTTCLGGRDMPRKWQKSKIRVRSCVDERDCEQSHAQA